jgi:hypothetical protein
MQPDEQSEAQCRLVLELQLQLRPEPERRSLHLQKVSPANQRHPLVHPQQARGANLHPRLHHLQEVSPANQRQRLHHPPRQVSAANLYQLDVRARERLQCRDRSEALRLRRLNEAKAGSVRRLRERPHICRHRHLTGVRGVVPNQAKEPEQHVQHRRPSVLHRQRPSMASRQRARWARLQSPVAAPAMFRPPGRRQSSARNSALLRQWVQQGMSLVAWTSLPYRDHGIL